MKKIIREDVGVVDVVVDAAAVVVGIKVYQTGYLGNPVGDALLGVAAGLGIKALGGSLLGTTGVIDL